MNTFAFLAMFIFGFILGFSTSSVLSLIFWLSVGYLALCAIDFAMGLGPRACYWRERVRSTVRSWFVRKGAAHNVVPLFR